MDLMLHPCLLEGLGNVLIEAQSAGVPCVTTARFVPIETKITDIISYVELDGPIQNWVDEVIKYKKYNRIDTSEQVTKSGFNVATQGSNLELRYSKLVGESN